MSLAVVAGSVLSDRQFGARPRAPERADRTAVSQEVARPRITTTDRATLAMSSSASWPTCSPSLLRGTVVIHRSDPLQIASGQTTSTATLFACAARASRSARSPVTTAPPGSAIATTRASTAEPARARRLSSAARRAIDSLTDGSMMHIFKNRCVLASRLGSPCRDSTRTIVGTIGGHSSCALNARMSDRAVLVRAERRDNPPLSSTSTGHPTRSSDRSRTRRAIASAVVCCRWLGSPTSAASSSR